MKKYIIGIYIFLGTLAVGQDLHFTQFYNAPLYLNPANTGRLKELYRISGIHRRQWAALNSDFISSAISGDFNLTNGILKNDKIGIGLYAYNDDQTQGRIKNTYFALSTAYHHYLGIQKRHRVSFGVQAGYGQKKINQNGLRFDNQYVDYNYNAGLSNNENLNNENLNNFDVQIGGFYTYVISSLFTLNTGISAYQLRKPNESILNNSRSNSLSTRWLGFLGLRTKLSESFHLSPQILYGLQSGTQDFNSAIIAQYFIKQNENIFISFGPQYRMNDALIGFLGFRFKPIELGLSYDLLSSNLKNGKGYQGATNKSISSYEISVNLYGLLSQKNKREYTLPCSIF